MDHHAILLGNDNAVLQFLDRSITARCIGKGPFIIGPKLCLGDIEFPLGPFQLFSLGESFENINIGLLSFHVQLGLDNPELPLLDLQVTHVASLGHHFRMVKHVLGSPQS